MLLLSGMVSWRTATSPGPGRGIETCREVGVEKSPSMEPSTVRGSGFILIIWSSACVVLRNDCRDQLWCRKKSIVTSFRFLFTFIRHKTDITYRMTVENKMFSKSFLRYPNIR